DHCDGRRPPLQMKMAMEEFPKKEIETLWCPWRVEYFEKEPRDRNFLSAAAEASDDAAHLVITRRKTAFLMMNRYPYAVGHFMPILAGTRTLSDGLRALYDKLIEAQSKMGGPAEPSAAAQRT